MKNRINVFVMTVLLMLGVIIWLLVRGQKTTTIVTVAAPTASGLAIQARTLPPLAASVESAPVTAAPIAAVPERQAEAIPAAKPAANANGAYTAVEGDTLSNVAAGLLGSDSRKNRNTVAAANPSLAADPDRVLTGKTYFLPAPGADAVSGNAADTVVAPVPDIHASSGPTTQPVISEPKHSDSDRTLKYTAQPGDSVSILAAGLLGGDSKTNRDAIINQNQSLQDNPDHVVAGKTYTIPTHAGLSAAATALPVRPTTQPDADEVVRVGTGRELRYIARPGDSVSKLAAVLLGSDTPANRDAIINQNASLKADPDRVVAGQTYSIPAPAAPIER